MTQTPRGNRTHIAIFGKTNAGKSSFLNTITGQDISLVSEVSGTTTDPVYKNMELLPIGPVVFIDTAGFDDTTTLGKLRIAKTKEIIQKMDMAILLISCEDIVKNNLNLEKEWITSFKDKPFIILATKRDKFDILNQKIFNKNILKIDTRDKNDIEKVKKELIKISKFDKSQLIGDKIKWGDKILLVAPQDIQAPKGRLILPQVQVLRDILDNGGIPTMITLENLEIGLKMNPSLVIVDSQIFGIVKDKTNLPLTSFSIIMARNKGDLKEYYKGAKKIDDLDENSRVLIAEACTHHALKGDIAREKIPKMLEKYGVKKIDNYSGSNFPKDLHKYDLVIHCGSCMLNRSETLVRIENSNEKNVPITNFGLAIAHMTGILDRAVEIFK